MSLGGRSRRPDHAAFDVCAREADVTMTTAPLNQAEINRCNAQKSTGSRTPEGKDRSQFNALKPGLTAKPSVLPGEDPEAFPARIDAWKADLKPQNAVEDYLIEQAARVSWQLDRADRAHTARLAANIRNGPPAEAHEQVG